MAAAGAGASRDTTATIRYFNSNPPAEVLDAGASTVGPVYALGEPLGVTKEEYKRRRHLVTEAHDVKIIDARSAEGGLSAWNLQTHGFCCVPSPPGVDFENDKAVKEVYYPRLLEMGKRLTGAKFGFMENHLKRTEDPHNLTSAYAAFCHADGSPDNEMLWRRALVRRGFPEEEAMSCEVARFGVWHPCDRPAFRNPLCLLDYSTVDFKHPDAVPMGDVVRYKYGGNSEMRNRDGSKASYNYDPKSKGADREGGQSKLPGQTKKGKPYGIGPLFSPKHRWVYISDQRPDECWFFKHYDCREGGAKATFHNSFYDSFHDKSPDTPGRRSLEARMILVFPKGSSSRL